MSADRTIEAMETLGWQYDAGSVGFTRGEGWVSFDQARSALDAAERGWVYEPEPEPVSREAAEIVAGAVYRA